MAIEKNDQGFISQLLDSDSSEKESELIIDNTLYEY